MAAYVLRRLFFSIFVLLGAVTLVFAVVRMVPGDPAINILGAEATTEQLEALRERMGLNRPIIDQYGTYLADLARLEFGESSRLGTDALDLVAARLPASVQLAVAALAFSLLVGIPFGVIAALRPNTLTDRTISLSSLIAQSAPEFWVGIVLILVFARNLTILPSAGNDTWRHLVLPAITLGLPYLALLVRLTRSGLLEVIHEGYVQTARSKGLPERIVILTHAMRNALIPIVTVIGLQFGRLLGVAVIVETVFAWPGIGRLLIESISHRDYAVVQASVLFITASFVLINLVVDLLYGYIDPRVRLEHA